MSQQTKNVDTTWDRFRRQQTLPRNTAENHKSQCSSVLIQHLEHTYCACDKHTPELPDTCSKKKEACFPQSYLRQGKEDGLWFLKYFFLTISSIVGKLIKILTAALLQAAKGLHTHCPFAMIRRRTLPSDSQLGCTNVPTAMADSNGSTLPMKKANCQQNLPQRLIKNKEESSQKSS